MDTQQRTRHAYDGARDAIRARAMRARADDRATARTYAALAGSPAVVVALTVELPR